MIIDQEIVIRVGVPLATAVVAAVIARVLQERPRLIKFVSHSSHFEWSGGPGGWGYLQLPGEEQSAGSGTPKVPAKSDALATAAEVDGAPSAAAPAVPLRFMANAHSVFIRNDGRKTATNVRIGQNARPYAFQIYPAASYDLLKGQGRSWEILVPTLVPQEWVQVAYLYDPWTRWADIDSYVKSDECMAIALNVAPVPLDSPVKRYGKHIAFYLGIAAAAYLLVRAGEWIYRVNS